ncbi:MAG TPA: VWA domain-containing protein [Anaerolineales bacterium]|jgi:VWFA-related protein|nr:VWA domain-containing protein [Anaerolineales bacterium]
MRNIPRIILTLGLLLVLALWSAPSAFAQTGGTQVHITQVDNSKFPQVTVYVSVTDASGQPVGVDPSTLQIYENGQLMQPTNISGGGQGGGSSSGPVTTLLVIDISGSMSKGNKIGAAQDAAKSYVSQMRSGDQAGVLAFDTQVYTVQPLTTDTAALTSAIDGLKPGSNTAMFDGLKEGVKVLEGVSGRKAIILLSDGLDNSSHVNVDDIVNAIGPSGVTISSIGFGDIGTGKAGQAGIDEASLKAIAQKTGGQYAYASDPQALSAAFQIYGSQLQNEYAITYTSPSALRDGVNRALSISLAGAPASAESQYNPGGVLPEVSTPQSWPLFGAILAGLLILLVVPLLITRGLQGGFSGFGGGGRKKSRIKFGGEQTAAAHPSPARGRVKMK